jgi:hypothetical protein
MSTDQVDSWGFSRKQKALFVALLIGFITDGILRGLEGWFPAMKIIASIWMEVWVAGVMYVFFGLHAKVVRWSRARRVLTLGLVIIVLVAYNLLEWYVEKKLGALIWNRTPAASFLGSIFTSLGWR